MEQEFRSLGINVGGDAGWGTHFCQFYRTKEDLLDTLVPYFIAGLKNNEFCIWLISEPLDEKEAQKAMKKALPDFNKFLRKGQIEILPHSDWYPQEGSFDSQRVLKGWIARLDQAQARGFDGLRLTENTSSLEKRDWGDFCEYEAEVDRVTAQYKMIALCTYSLDRCGASEALDAVKNHRFALIKREGKWETLESSGSKKAEERLRKADQKINTILDSIGHCHFFLDRDWRVTEVNPEAQEIFGRTREELIGKVFWEEFPQAMGTEFYRQYLRAMKEQIPVHFEGESRIVPRWLEAHAYPDRDGLSVYFRDITERKITEEDLRRSRDESELRVQERTYDLIKRLKELNCLYTVSSLLNKEEGSLGDALEKAIQRIPFGWQFSEITCARIIIQGREFGTENCKETIWKQSSGIISQGKLVGTLEVYYLEEKPEKDEGPFLKEERILIDALADQVGEFLGRRQVQESLRATNELLEGVFSSIDLHVVYMDKDFNIIRVNRAYAEGDGRKPEFYLGRNYFALFPHGENEEIFRRVVETGQPYFVLEKPFTYAEHPERGITYWDWSLHPVKEADGKVSGVVFSLVNVTARKRAQEALWQTEERLHKVLNTLPVGVWVTDKKGSLLMANPASRNIWGGVQHVGIEKYGEYKGWWADTGKRIEADEWALTRAILKGEVSLNEVVEIESFDGKRKTILNSAVPLRGPNQEIIGAIAVNEDITERKRTEDALKEAERKLRLIAESVTEVIFAYDQNRRLIFVNPAIEKLSGYTVEELQGKNFINWCHPEDAAKMLKVWEEGFEGTVFPNPEFRIVTKDGRVKWCQSSWTPLYDETGQRIGTVIIDRDITERRISEQDHLRLVTAVEQATEGIAILDVDQSILYMNPAFENLHDLSREVLERKYEDILNVDEKGEEFRRRLQETLSRGEVWNGHFTLRKGNGSTCELEVGISPIKGVSGNPIHYVTVERDVTREIKLEERVRQWQKMEALGTLAGGIAHDLNNILMPIMINTDLVLLDVREGIPPSPHHLKLVQEAATRGQELVKQIITFGRPKEQVKTLIEINPVVKEALNFLRSTIPKSIEIRGRIEAEPALVLADPTQIHQVLMNLCNNAAYAMREKGGLLEVELAGIHVDWEVAAQYPGLKPGPYLRLTVRDTGHGMDRGVRERAFDPFFTTKKPGEGTGMGLAVVHGIVKNHQGVITLESEAGKGTTVYVFFPSIQGKREPETVSPGPIPRGKERILLIDDEEIQVRSIQNMLERLGYRVIGKTDAREALEMFQARPEIFDLVITDQTMPYITGDKLAREFLSIRPDVPIILCTGFSEAINEQEARSLGVRDFAMKPMAVRDLAERIRKVLKK